MIMGEKQHILGKHLVLESWLKHQYWPTESLSNLSCHWILKYTWLPFKCFGKMCSLRNLLRKMRSTRNYSTLFGRLFPFCRSVTLPFSYSSFLLLFLSVHLPFCYCSLPFMFCSVHRPFCFSSFLLLISFWFSWFLQVRFLTKVYLCFLQGMLTQESLGCWGVVVFFLCGGVSRNALWKDEVI